MNATSYLLIVTAVLSVASAQDTKIIEKKDVVYAEPASPLHTLDVYASPSAKNASVVFWIHGGGWQGRDKSDVAEKPRFFVEKGFVFASVNYRLLPKVDMIDIFTVFAAKDTNHSKLNDNLGVAGDPTTKVLLEFIEALPRN